MARLSIDAFRNIEQKLSAPLFLGVPLGATLNDTMIINFCNGQGKWNSKSRVLNRIRLAKYRLFPRITKNILPPLPKRQILVAWLDKTQRITDLVLPVVQELKDENCCVLSGNQNVASLVPHGVSFISWDQIQSYLVKDWRKEYQRCKTQWAVQLKTICKQYELPAGSFDQLAFVLMISSQQVMACIAFLRTTQPAVILTDYDRNSMWSCLVLSARLLGIPSVTLVHGVMHKDAIGYSPVLADKIICWGESDRSKLINAGEPPEKILIGGCPRLSSDLAISTDDSHIKLSLGLQRPVIMYATSLLSGYKSNKSNWLEV